MEISNSSITEWKGNGVQKLYESENIVALSKPAGLLVHRDGASDEPTLVDWIITHYPFIKGVGEVERLKDGSVIDRPGIVHRLDKETSGLILIAKNNISYNSLKEAFANRTIQKTYRAISYGLFRDLEGVIDKPIGRHARDFKQWSAERGARGELRNALTKYSVLCERKMDKDLMNLLSRPKGSATINGVSYLEVYPHTGRTHQIRVHLKAIGHPIANDLLYASSYPRIKRADRMMLHAYRIVLPEHLFGNETIIECPFPDDMQNVLSMFPQSLESAEY